MFDRMYRENPASPPKADTNTGRRRWLVRSQIFPARPRESYSSETSPEMGSHLSFTPNRIMSSRASQNVGTANPVNTTTVENRASHESCRPAEEAPMVPEH